MRWGGTLRCGGVRRRKHFGRDKSRPLTVEKGVFTPWPPLRGGSARRRWGRELCGCPKYFGFRLSKNVFCLVACVGATIGRPPAYRSNAFSGTVSCKANGHGRAMLAPTRVFRQSVAAPHFRCPLCRTGVYFSLLTNVVSLCYLVIG